MLEVEENVHQYSIAIATPIETLDEWKPVEKQHQRTGTLVLGTSTGLHALPWHKVQGQNIENCKFSELMAIKDDQSVFVAWQVNYYRIKWIIENTKHFITRSFN